MTTRSLIRALSNMASNSKAWLSEMLANESFLHYHSYYKEVRHNHNAHGAVAIAELGGTKERVQRFYDEMNKHMKPYDPNTPLAETLEIDYLKSDKLSDYRGKNQGFYKMLNLYEEMYEKKYNKDIFEMIKSECPPIIDGPLYAAFHGIIQIAYGMVGQCNQTMLEGIVFMDQQYSPFFLDDQENKKRKDLSCFGQGQTDIMDIFKKLREDKELIKDMNEENKKDMNFRKETHMFGIYGWSGPKYHSDHFLDLADDIKFPEWFDPNSKDMTQLMRLIDWFCDMATVLYVKSDSVNDFFLLHGVTASWSAKHILPLFDYDTALLALRSNIASIYVVYVMQGVPDLNRTPEEYTSEVPTQEIWDKFIKTTLEDKDYETHVYKVIQCMYDSWKANPNSEYAKYYLAGAKLVRDNHYARGLNSTFPNDDLSV